MFYKKNNIKNRKGFIAIASLLVITAISMIFATSILRDGLYNTRSSLSSLYYENARTNAQTCVEDAMIRMKREQEFYDSIYYEYDENNSCILTMEWGVPEINPENSLITETPVDLIVSGSSNDFNRTFLYELILVRFDIYNGEDPKEYINQIKLLKITETTESTENLNHAPHFDPISDKTTEIGNSLNYPLEFTIHAEEIDPDDSVTYLMDPILPGASLNPSSGDFYWAPVLADQGNYTVNFIARDTHEAEDVQEVNIEVLGTNTIPMFVTPEYSEWQNRLRITVKADEVAEDQVDFPVLMLIDDSIYYDNFWANVNEDGDDIIITSSDSITRLPVDLVYIYNDEEETRAELYFKADFLDADEDTVFYLYYNNDGTVYPPGPDSPYGSESVWENGYAAVFHLNENGTSAEGGYYDSTENGNHGTGYGMTPEASDVEGKIITAQYFDGANNWIALSNEENFDFEYNTDVYTLQAWVETSDSEGGVITKMRDSEPFQGYDMGISDSGKLTANLINNWNGGVDPDAIKKLTDESVNNSSWHLVSQTYDASGDEAGVSLYIDGALASASAISSPVETSILNGEPVIIGSRNDGSRFEGKIDEVRISDVKRSAGWIETQYNNQNHPELFIEVLEDESGAWHRISGGETLAFKMEAYDPDVEFGDSLTYSITDVDPPAPNNQPEIIGATGDFSWVTVEDDQNTYNIDFKVEDDFGGSDETRVTVEVTGGNEGPDLDNPARTDSWRDRLKITIPAAKILSAQQNFPIYVDLSLADTIDHFWNNIKANGDDLMVTAGDGTTRLPLEIADINVGDRTGELYFKANELIYNQENIFYIYYDNPSAEQPAANETFGRNDVWSNNYMTVLHMNESGDQTDSTGRGNDALGVNNTLYDDDERGSVQALLENENNNNAYLRIPDNDDIGDDGMDQLSLSMWYKSLDTTKFRCLAGSSHDWLDDGYSVYLRPPSEPGGDYNFAVDYETNGWWGGDTKVRAGTGISNDWEYFTGTHNGSEITLYINGNELGSAYEDYAPDGSRDNSSDDNPATFNDTNDNGGLYIGLIEGFNTFGPDWLYGYVDEVRLSNTARPANWVAIEYDNQNNPGDFMAIEKDEFAGIFTIVLDEQLQFELQADDPNEDPITYSMESVSSQPPSGDFELDGRNFDWTPVAGDEGDYEIVFRADSLGGFDTETIIIHVVTGINQAPVFDYPVNNSWNDRIELTVPATLVEANLTDFPVYMNLSSISLLDTDFWSTADPDGNDFLLTGADGMTRIPAEIVSVDTGAGKTGELYFKADLDDNTDSTFYLYYNNPPATQPAADDTYGSENVWSNDYSGVWHMTEVNAVDSSGNHNDGTQENGVTSAADGHIGTGNYFADGDIANGDRINLGNDSSLRNDERATVEAWVQMDSGNSGQYLGIAGKLDSSGEDGYALVRHDSNEFRLYVGDDWNISYARSNDDYTDTDWHYVAGTMNSGTNYIYVDGARQTDSDSRHMDESDGNAYIGRQYDDYDRRHWKGKIDEVRISGVARSDGWIETQYNNQYDPTAFVTTDTSEETALFIINTEEELAFTLVANDEDFDDIDYSVTDITPDPDVDPEITDDNFSWTPAASDGGDYTITFQADDGNGGTDEITILVQVINSCNGTLVGGYCWYYGNYSQSCNDVCTSNGSIYNVATRDYAGSAGSKANCETVLEALIGSPGSVMDWGGSSGNGCLYYMGGRYRITSPETTGGASEFNRRRACACDN